MRWRILISVGRWRLQVGRCPQCGWPKVAVVCDGVMREWPNAQPSRADTSTVEGIVLRLRSLERYIVGCADDGDGHMYDYADECEDGDWIRASDVADVIEAVTQNAGHEARRQQKKEGGQT